MACPDALRCTAMESASDRDPHGCSAARAMEILGERWTFLILHEAFHGVRRFSEMQRNLGIARNILSARLQLLVRTGILEKRRYQDEPERYMAVVRAFLLGRPLPERQYEGTDAPDDYEGPS